MTLLSARSSSAFREADDGLLRQLQSLQRLLRPTPVIPLAIEGLDLHAKLEYQNPIGSVKDRSAFWVLKQAVLEGRVHAGTTIIESSSGNFASALAFYCRLLGLPFIPVIDPNIAGQYEAFLRQNCRRVEKVSKRDATGGFLQTRLDLVQTLLEEIPNSYWTNQYANEHNMNAHYTLTGQEICDGFDRLDYIFLGVSSGGTVAGISLRVKEKWPDVKVIAVDAQGSVIFGGPPKRRHIPGLGSSIVPPMVERAKIDAVEMVSERAAVRGCKTLLDRYGLFVGGSTGSVFSAIMQYAPRIQCPQNPKTVLFLCADRGTAYLDTVFCPEWAERLED